MPKATITSKGQVTIPKVVRDRLGLRAGDRLDFRIDSMGDLMVKPLTRDDELPSLAGFLDDRVPVRRNLTVEEMSREMEEFVAEEVMRGLRDWHQSSSDDRG